MGGVGRAGGGSQAEDYGRVAQIKLQIDDLNKAQSNFDHAQQAAEEMIGQLHAAEERAVEAGEHNMAKQIQLRVDQYTQDTAKLHKTLMAAAANTPNALPMHAAATASVHPLIPSPPELAEAVPIAEVCCELWPGADLAGPDFQVFENSASMEGCCQACTWEPR